MVYSNGRLQCILIKTMMQDFSLPCLSWVPATSTLILLGTKSMSVLVLAPLTQSTSLLLTSTQIWKWSDLQIPPPLSLLRLSLRHGTTTHLCGLLHLSPIWLMEKFTGLRLIQPPLKCPGDVQATDSFSGQMVASPHQPLMTPFISAALNIALFKLTKTTLSSDSQLSKTQLCSCISAWKPLFWFSPQSSLLQPSSDDNDPLICVKYHLNKN